MTEDHAKDHKDDKTAKAAKPAKRPPNDDDTGDPAPAAAAKQKTLATALSRAIVIATLLGSAAYTAGALFGGRYELLQSPNKDNNFVYRLDRLTGAVRFCGQQQCVDIGVADPK